MHPRHFLFPAALAAACAATPLLAWPASNTLRVNGTAQDFTVAYRPSNIVGDYWCAAADFAIGKLRLSPTTTIYRTTASSPRAIGHMGFSIDPAKSSGETGIVTIGRQDGGFSAAHAQSMCQGPRTIFPDD
ncbi:hypothetical protein V8J36_11290 [Frigidibacter sp. MR17.14]|uniref:hypothetical protein n=1 Tax=Frigidibacter sp. MR17.14 TaxID=3126509 RepID=UPI003012B3B1